MTAIEEMEQQCAFLTAATENLGDVDESDPEMTKFRLELSMLSMRCRIEEAKQLTDIAAILSTLAQVLDAIRRLTP